MVKIKYILYVGIFTMMSNIFLSKLCGCKIDNSHSSTQDSANTNENTNTFDDGPVGEPHSCFDTKLLDWEDSALTYCRHFYEECDLGVDKYDYYSCLVEMYGHESDESQFFCPNISAFLECDIEKCLSLETCERNWDCTWDCVNSECGFGVG